MYIIFIYIIIYIIIYKIYNDSYDEYLINKKTQLIIYKNLWNKIFFLIISMINRNKYFKNIRNIKNYGWKFINEQIEKHSIFSLPVGYCVFIKYYDVIGYWILSKCFHIKIKV